MRGGGLMVAVILASLLVPRAAVAETATNSGQLHATALPTPCCTAEVAEGQRIYGEIRLALIDVRRLEEKARQKKDVVELQCVLTFKPEVQKAADDAGAAQAALEQAAASDDAATVDSQLRLLRILKTQAVDSANSARKCAADLTPPYEGGLSIICDPFRVDIGEDVTCTSGPWDCDLPLDESALAPDPVAELIRLILQVLGQVMGFVGAGRADFVGPPAPGCGVPAPPPVGGSPPVVWALRSEPRVLGATYLGTDGHSSITFQVPLDAETGTHTVYAASVSGGEIAVVQTNIEVGSTPRTSAALPATGSPVDDLLLLRLGLVLVCVGGLLEYLRRRYSTPR